MMTFSDCPYMLRLSRKLCDYIPPSTRSCEKSRLQCRWKARRTSSRPHIISFPLLVLHRERPITSQIHCCGNPTDGITVHIRLKRGLKRLTMDMVLFRRERRAHIFHLEQAGTDAL